MPNHRFQKVMVLTNVANFITTNTVTPKDLALNQVGMHLVDQFEKVGVGVGATPSPTTAPLVQFHQNIGDNNFGTIRTKTISPYNVKRYYSQHSANPTIEQWYIGYDEVDGTKDIQVNFDKDIQIRIHVWDKKLARWYNNNPGYTKNIVINTGIQPSGNTSGFVDQDTIANLIINQINGTVAPPGDYKTGIELPNYMIASKVFTGTPGTPTYRVGVKILGILPVQELIGLDPIRYYEPLLTTFDVQLVNAQDTTITMAVTKFAGATSGAGFPKELAAMEAESQGYDRVFEVFENVRYMKKNFIILAVDGAQYDYIYLQYDWTHNVGPRGAAGQQITEQYTLVLAGPTGTIQPVAAVLNSWLVGLQAAVTV